MGGGFMIRQHFILPDYDWEVWVYYAVSCYYAQEIVSRMSSLGASAEEQQRAWRNMNACKLNTGLTYSNFKRRRSVVVIALTSTPDEFQNSYDHEKGHLCQHIVQAADIDPFGEEAQYLAGEIGQKMFSVAKKFMCEHCRRKLYN